MEEEPSVLSNAAYSPPHLHRPVPVRAHDAAELQDPALAPATPASVHERRSSSDFLAQLNARLLRAYYARIDAEERESRREHGVLAAQSTVPNLTTSTLSGIYYDLPSAAAETPWGTGAETPPYLTMGSSIKHQPMGEMAGKQMVEEAPDHIASRQARQAPFKYFIVVGKLAALFLFGAVYGLIVSHLHEARHLATVHVEGVSRRSWLYLASWGLFGLIMGNLLPYVDLLWAGQQAGSDMSAKEAGRTDSPISEQINDIVRSVGAFIGIAFAIRRLPWQSTLQLTFTLALVNPALWYILDRSKPGVSLALAVTSLLTSLIFLANPNALPSPSLPATTNNTRLPATGKSPSQPAIEERELFVGIISYENLAIVTWVGSILFCSCVCFGSIGRRLAVWERSGSKR